MKNSITDVQTTPLFWDCECKENYIHNCNDAVCNNCGCKRDDSPDSRPNEIGIDQILYPHTPERNTYILQKLIDYTSDKQLKMFVQKIISEEHAPLNAAP
jgi:hypothetical protein